MMQRLTSAVSALLIVLGSFSLAAGQSISVTPQQLNFNVPAGVSISAAQQVTVTPDAAAQNSGASFTVNAQSASWLFVQGTSSGTIPTLPAGGAKLSVSVSTQGLVAGQTYNGLFTVQLMSAGASQVVVNVTLSVGGSSSLFATPSSLAFTAVQGSQIGSPSSQSVTIGSTNGTVSFSLSPQTQAGGNWLSISSTGGVTGAPSGTFSVSALPTGLVPGTYTGTITAATIPAGSLAQISVTLTITATSTLTVTPATASTFLYQIGGTLPASQSFSLTTNGGAISFNVSVSPFASWLVVNPQSGTATATTPAIITVTATPTGLPPAAYNTSLIITPVGGSPLPPIAITLVVSNNPVLLVTPSSLSFTSPFAGLSPVDQTLKVSTSGGAVAFSVTTDQPWLSALASASATPAQVTVHVNPAGLAVGSYMGNVTLRPSNGDNYTILVPVTYTINNPAQVTASPAALLFSFQTNRASPTSQSIQVLSTGGPVQITVTAATTNCGANWLTASASQTSTPAAITVSVNTSGMTAGVCSGTVSVAYTGASAPLMIPVSVAVSASSLLSISLPAGFGTESVQVGAAPLTRSISLTSTDPSTAVQFTAAGTTSSTGGWLAVGPGTGSTPQNLIVTIVPAGLSPGTYGGQLAISSPSFPSDIPNKTFVIPVNFTVNPSITVSVTPSALAFTETQGGSSPPTQTLTLTSAGGLATFTAAVTQITGGDWLDVSPTSGNASRDLTVTIKPNSLPTNAVPYSAQIVLAFQNSATAPITIPVSLTVVNPQTITASASSLSFTYQLGANVPVPQKLTISSPGGPVQFSLGTASTPGGWLSADTTSAMTPKDVTISVNPQGLGAGTYTGSVSIATPGLASPFTIPVTFTVSTAAVPQILTITNAASSLSGSISPGELVTAKGTAIGPVNATNGGLFTLNSRGGVDPALQGVRVLFDSIPGTPIYVSPTQINAIAPWEINGRLNTNVVVEFNGIQSPPVQVRVDSVTPAIYTLNTTGSGQAAVVNQDFSYNGPPSATTKPAPQNSVISVYANGGGQTTPASTTGSVSPPNQLLRIAGPVSAMIGGQNANIEFIGAAPGLITGVVQVNLRVPVGVTGNNLPVSFTINGVTSPIGPTVAVQ